jgi:CHAD domain-containing protein
MGHATTTVSSGLTAALARQFDALARRWSAVRDGDVKAVHRARVASRRLREVLSVIDAAYRHSHAGRAARTARRLTRVLGPVREIDVALIELDRAIRRHGWPDELGGMIRRRLVQQRERRAKRMAARITKQERVRVRDEVRAVATRLAKTDDRAWQSALAARVVRRARAVLGASAAAGTLYVPERLHALRITIKKLRYALELLPPTPGFDVADALALLKRAQQRFGTLHDVQVLTSEVHAIDATARRPADRVALGAAIEDLERDCREIHAKALALVPDVAECARQVRRELGVRRRGRRLAMAKATLDEKAEESTARLKA